MASKKAETLFKEKVQKDLDSLGEECWHEKIQQVTVRGTPDMLVCYRGHFIALELKKDWIDDPDPLQLYKINKIKKAGGLAFVVYPQNWDETFELIKTIASYQIK